MCKNVLKNFLYVVAVKSVTNVNMELEGPLSVRKEDLKIKYELTNLDRACGKSI